MTNLELYNEYRATLKNLLQAKRKYQTKGNKQHIGFINSMIRDVKCTLCDLEAYLPLEQRKYSIHRQHTYTEDDILPRVPPPRRRSLYDIYHDVSLRRLLHEVIDTLCNEEQKYILSAYFMYNRTLKQIANKLGVREATVCQRMKRILIKIRESKLFSIYFCEKH
jgi:RNA polymerase sigma factor (sigma-70 family)